MEEEWRDVVGWEGVYQVSSLARIRRMVSTPWKRAGIIEPYYRNGYPCVYLGRNGNDYKSPYVHRLVARAFLGEPPIDKPEVNHIDGNRADSSLANIEWCSPSYNVQDAKRREWSDGGSIGRGNGIRMFDKYDRK